MWTFTKSFVLEYDFNKSIILFLVLKKVKYTGNILMEEFLFLEVFHFLLFA